MKKLIAVSIILALFASFVAAQEEAPKWYDSIGIGSWNQGVFVPFGIYDAGDATGKDDFGNEDVFSSIGPYWMNSFGGGQVRTNAVIAGATEFAGFRIDIGYDSGLSYADTDNAKVWIKPIKILKLTYGKMKEDDFRGRIGDFSFFAPLGFTSLGGVRNQDTIFTRFQPTNGFHFALAPIEGLRIEGSVDLTGAKTAKDAFKTGQIGVGYAISDIGEFRVQYIGGRGAYGTAAETFDGSSNDHYEWTLDADGDGTISTAEKAGSPVWQPKTGAAATKPGRDTYTMEAAFAFTGVEGLVVDVGIKVPFDVQKSKKLFEGAIGATFGSGDFGIAALIDLQAFKDQESTDIRDDFDFYAYLVPSYNLGSFIVGADLGFDNKSSWSVKKSNGDASAKGALDLGVWIKKPVAGGNFQIGVMAGIPFGDYVKRMDNPDGSGNWVPGSGNVRFSIPISAEVYF